MRLYLIAAVIAATGPVAQSRDGAPVRRAPADGHGQRRDAADGDI